MADFWIKVEKSTPDKAEIFEMAALLDIDPDAVLGKLIRVWSWIDSNSEDGHIKSVTHVLIDRVTNCGGFSKAMMEVGWLGETEVPNFDRHLGENAKKRAKDAERKRKSRNTSKECPKKSVTQSGLDKSREDKSREDNKEIVISDSGKPQSKRFTPPTQKEVYDYMGEYAQDKGEIISEQEPEKFVNFYSAKNWYVGKTKMKDWKASARNWVLKAIEHKKSKPSAKWEHGDGWGEQLINDINDGETLL